jgi:hypothetical protein
VKSNLQAKLHLNNVMTNIEKCIQGVGLVANQGRSKKKISKYSSMFEV